MAWHRQCAFLDSSMHPKSQETETSVRSCKRTEDILSGYTDTGIQWDEVYMTGDHFWPFQARSDRPAR